MKTVASVVCVLALTGAVSGTAVAQVRNPVLDGMVNGAREAVSAAPSWQAICGYKWRQYRQATGASGRDAYYAFMRAPEELGGCGAGEARARTRGLAERPGDAAIKDAIAAQSKATLTDAQIAAVKARFVKARAERPDLKPEFDELEMEWLAKHGLKQWP